MKARCKDLPLCPSLKHLLTMTKVTTDVILQAIKNFCYWQFWSGTPFLTALLIQFYQRQLPITVWLNMSVVSGYSPVPAHAKCMAHHSAPVISINLLNIFNRKYSAITHIHSGFLIKQNHCINANKRL